MADGKFQASRLQATAADDHLLLCIASMISIAAPSVWFQASRLQATAADDHLLLCIASMISIAAPSVCDLGDVDSTRNPHNPYYRFTSYSSICFWGCVDARPSGLSAQQTTTS